MPETKNHKSNRVLHVVPALFRKNDGVLGGAERYAFELARNMAKELPTTLVSFGSKYEHFTEDNLSIFTIPPLFLVKGNPTNPFSPKLFHFVKNADVIHCHQQQILATTFCAGVSRLLRKRVFVTELGGGGWDISHYLPVKNWFHGRLHISEFSQRVSSDVKSQKSHVIFGGIDLKKFSPTNSTRNNTILYVGRVLPHKGIHHLIEALDSKMQLDIIGHISDKRYVSDLENMARGKSVQFLDNIDDAQLVEAYRSARVVVLPSVYRDLYGRETTVPELLGQTIMEAMACETPVICTQVASLPEIVRDGVDGFVVPPNDSPALYQKLQWIMDHPGRAREMGTNARKRISEKFSWTHVVRRCRSIYMQPEQ